MPTVVRTYIPPEEVYTGRNVKYDDIAKLAATLNRTEALKFLGYLNLVLSSATTESHLSGSLQPVQDVQAWLLREIVSSELLRDLQARFPNSSLLDRPLLHRSQLLFAIRVVATHGRTDGGNTLAERSDFDAVGDLVFLINGLFKVPPATSESATALWVATQMGPQYELENPPTIDLAWPRIEELLTRRLPKVAADPEGLERLERITVFTTGFSLRAWLDLSWMFFSYWGTLNFRELMGDLGRGYLNPFEPYEVVASQVLLRAVDGIGVRFDDLPTHLKIDEFSHSVLFDLTPFRSKPLWVMPDGLVLCVDAALLMDRLGPHVFWSAMNALDTEERREQFSSAWGLAFESHCWDALRRVFRGRKWSFVPNPIDTSTGNELWDAVACRDTTAIVIECKGTFIRSADKYSGVPRRFLRGVTKKFGRGKKGGVRQLVRGISRQWFRQEAHGVISRPEAVTDVFPILLVQDPIFGCGPVARVVSDRFSVALRRARRETAGTGSPKIWPVSVITADELDLLAAGIESTGWRLDAILKRFHRTRPSRMFSLGSFLWSGAAADFGFPAKAQAVVQRRFRAGTEAILERFRSADYGKGIDLLHEETDGAFQ